MSDLFDFLGCMSLINGRSSNSPHARPSHPKRQPPRLRLPGDAMSSVPSAALTPHPPSQPYYSRYPITRAPTVREFAAPSLPTSQAMLPDYPCAVRHVARYSQAPTLHSPPPYWKTYGTPAPTGAYVPNQSYAPRAASESYLGPLPYPQQPVTMSYYLPPSEVDFYGRPVTDAESYVEEEDPLWAYRSYPSQFPSAQARVARAKAEQPPFYHPCPPTGASVTSDERFVLPHRTPREALTSPLPREACQSHRQNSASMSCAMEVSESASPSRETHYPPQTHVENTGMAVAAIPEDSTSCPLRAELLSQQPLCESEKVEDLEKGPLTTMAETSDDAGASDTWSAMQACLLNEQLCQHSPEMLGAGGVLHSNIPSECVCQQCRNGEVLASHAASADVIKAAHPSEKAAKSPLEGKGITQHSLPAFQPLITSSSPNRDEAPTQEASVVQSKKAAAEGLVEAGVGTESMESGPSISWSSCSSVGPLSNEIDALTQQKQLVIKELVGKQTPADHVQRHAGDVRRKGEESLVRKRVEEWNERLSVLAANESPARPRVSQKRLSGSIKTPSERRTIDEMKVPDGDESSCAKPDRPYKGCGEVQAVSQSTMSPPTEAVLASESAGNAEDLYRLIRSPGWSQYLDTLPASQKHSPSPTQLPRNPFMASTERTVYVMKNLEMSSNVVPRQLDQSMSKHQSALRLSLESDATKRIQLARQLTAVVARDDLDKQLQHYLRQNGIPFEFVRLKRSYYAVCRPEDDHKGALLHNSEEVNRRYSSLCTFESSVYFGRAQQAVAQLPPTVLCYIVVSLDLGRLAVAVLSRSNVLKHFGCEGIRKWLTPDNRFFTQRARRKCGGSDERRRSLGSCAQITSRRHKEELPAGGEFPWRRGQAEPIASFIDFLHRVASEIPKEGNSDPFPTRIPFEATSTMSFRHHNRRASS